MAGVAYLHGLDVVDGDLGDKFKNLDALFTSSE